MSVFSDRLLRLRVSANERQGHVAKEIGCSQSCLGNYERGEREPDVSTIINIARHFGVSADYLLGLDGDQPDSTYIITEADAVSLELSALEIGVALKMFDRLKAVRENILRVSSVINEVE